MRYNDQVESKIYYFNQDLMDTINALKGIKLKNDCILNDIHCGVAHLEYVRNMTETLVNRLELVYESISIDNESKLLNHSKEK